MKAQGKADMIFLAKIMTIFISIYLKKLKNNEWISGIFFLF